MLRYISCSAWLGIFNFVTVVFEELVFGCTYLYHVAVVPCVRMSFFVLESPKSVMVVFECFGLLLRWQLYSTSCNPCGSVICVFPLNYS
jgi:hypothetical protein